MLRLLKKNKLITSKSVFIFLNLIFIPYLACAQEVTITQPLTISESDNTYDNKSIVIDGATVVINGTHSFENIKVINQGKITHDLENRIELIVENTVELNNSSIDVSAKGLLASELSALYSGGSHAGFGGAREGTFAANTYGHFSEPVSAGLGGRSGSLVINDETGTRGGGVIKISATNIILDSGYITANGGSNLNYELPISGGAGGSIWINAQNISAASYSYITATGGAGAGYYLENDYWYPVSDGAGGRIHLAYMQSSGAMSFHNYSGDSDLILRAYGTEYYETSNYHGAHGTIYLEDLTEQKSTLNVIGFDGVHDNNHKIYAAYTPLQSIPAGVNLVTQGAKLKINTNTVDFKIQHSNSKIIFTEDVVVQSSLRHIDAEGNSTNSMNLVFNKNVNFLTELPEGKIAVDGILTVPDDHLIVEHLDLTLRLSHQFQAIDVNSGKITPVFANDHQSVPFVLTAESINIMADGAIDASDKGIYVENTSGFDGFGYSHGGRGKSVDGVMSGATYGDYEFPNAFGQGYGNDDCRGGGAFKIVATTLLLDGHIRADGNYCGSGGSVWVDVGSITSSSTNASITVDSNSQEHGGGRVAIHFEVMTGFDPLLQVSAFGYSPGTIYYKNKNIDGSGVLLIKNSENRETNTVTDITIKNQVDQLIVENANIAISGITALNSNWNFKDSSVSINDSLYLNQLPLTSNTILTFNDDIELSSSILFPEETRLFFGKDLTIDGDIVGLNGFPFISVDGTVMTASDDLIIDGYTLELDSSQSFENLHIKNNGVLTTAKAIDETTAVVELDAENIIIDAGSKIDVSQKGLGFASGSGDFDGGSHGGLGGNSYFSDYGSGTPVGIYGDPIAPNTFGRGSKTPNWPQSSSYGGGAIKIIADVIELNGEILANGEPLINDFGGSAAGGSIFLDVGTLKSSNSFAKISANGSDGSAKNLGWWGSYRAGGGGGGRIAIHYDVLDGIGIQNLSVAGGLQTQSAQSGAPGTLYLHNKNNPNERVIHILGHLIDGYNNDQFAKSSLMSVGNVSVSVKNTSIEHTGNLSLKNLILENADTRILGELILSDELTVNNSSVWIKDPSTIDGNLSLSNSADLTFSRQTNIHGSTTIVDSSIYFEEEGEVAAFDLHNGSAIFYMDATLKGATKLLNSHVNVEGNLNAISPILMQTNAENLRIASYDDWAYWSANGDTVFIDENSSVEEKASTLFKVVRGLGDANGVSFEAMSSPGVFLKVVPSSLQMIANDQTPEFAADATFYLRESYRNDDYLSFESMNFPYHYVNYNNGELRVEPLINSQNDSDSTWAIVDSNENEIVLDRLTTITIKGNAVFSQGLVGTGVTSPLLVVGNDLTMPNNNLIVDGINVSLAKNHTFNNIELKNSATLTIPEANNNSSRNKGLSLIAKQVVIDESSKIDLSAKELDTGNFIRNVGGSHGGKGGNNGSAVAAPTYGDIRQPITVGYSGYYNSGYKTFGGSAFKLTADSIDLNGAIVANGQQAHYDISAAAGGSIWLIANSLISSTGNGRIYANGGDAPNVTTSGGGGGRIALYYQTISGFDDSNIAANGGYQGITPSQAGENGTIHREVGSVPPHVISINTQSLTNQPVEFLHIKFSAPIDVTTFTTEDVVLKNATQTIIPISAITEINDTEYQLQFSPALLTGSYSLTVGPNILGKNNLLLD